MKKYLAVFCISALLLACNKEDGDETETPHCPIIAASIVPQAVKDSFVVHYPATIVKTWFQKGSIGYCAYFIATGNKRKLAEFNGSGVFIMEEMDIDHDGNFEDSTGISSPKLPGDCECEIPD